MNNDLYDKKAIIKVIEWLNSIEPKCAPCEQCKLGYKFDELSKYLCHNRQLDIQEQHEDWERKMKKWQGRLKYAE